MLADYSSISDDPDGGEGTPIAYPIDIVQCTAVQFLGKVALISGIAISARTLERFVEQCRPLLDSRCAALARFLNISTSGIELFSLGFVWQLSPLP